MNLIDRQMLRFASYLRAKASDLRQNVRTLRARGGIAADRRADLYEAAAIDLERRANRYDPTYDPLDP